MELADFLLARIAEDEAVARKASPGLWRADGREVHRQVHVAAGGARVLAECEAKRRIVEMARRFTAAPDDSGTDLVLDDVLRLLALPYAAYPDYRSEWASVTT